MRSFIAVSSLLTLTSLVSAAPAPAPLFGISFGSGDKDNGTPTPVSQSDITSKLQLPAFFARAAYCDPQTVSDLSCGAPCDAIKNLKVLASGGDQGATPRCELFDLDLSIRRLN